MTQAKNLSEQVQELAMAIAVDQNSQDASIKTKADKSTTLSGYGIGDAYTKNQIDTSLTSKADLQDIIDICDLVISGN